MNDDPSLIYYMPVVYILKKQGQISFYFNYIFFGNKIIYALI